jgi:hypothetical protein
MVYPPPKTGFVQALERVSYQGETRWRDVPTGRIYTWDRLHGEFEVYNQRGHHLGVVDPNGHFIKDAVKGRTINV